MSAVKKRAAGAALNRLFGHGETVGRPVMEPGRRRRKNLVIRCRVEDLERWHRAAAGLDGGVSGIARELLDAWADSVIAAAEESESK